MNCVLTAVVYIKSLSSICIAKERKSNKVCFDPVNRKRFSTDIDSATLELIKKMTRKQQINPKDFQQFIVNLIHNAAASSGKW